MLINTEKLRENIERKMTARCKSIDQNIKDDHRAMAVFSRLESEQMEIDKAIIYVESLYNQYCSLE